MPAECPFSSDSRPEYDARCKERRIAELAARQHGVVTRQQLRSLGFSESAITRRIAQRRLIAVHRAVYAVGHGVLTTRGRWLAAVLASGPGAVLSHRSAAALWKLGTGGADTIDVATPQRRQRTAAVRIHRVQVAPDEVTRVEGIPVTTVARTLLDLASVLRLPHLEAVVGIAEQRSMGDSPSLPELLERYPRFRGRRNLRAVLKRSRLGIDVPESELEIRFLALLDRHGLPPPRVNEWITIQGRRFKVDCLWPDARLIAELDSRRHHEGIAFETDRERDRILAASGFATVRVTWRQLHESPAAVVRDMAAALGRRMSAQVRISTQTGRSP